MELLISTAQIIKARCCVHPHCLLAAHKVHKVESKFKQRHSISFRATSFCFRVHKEPKDLSCKLKLFLDNSSSRATVYGGYSIYYPTGPFHHLWPPKEALAKRYPRETYLYPCYCHLCILVLQSHRLSPMWPGVLSRTKTWIRLAIFLLSEGVKIVRLLLTR